MDEDDNGKFRLEKVTLLGSTLHVCWDIVREIHMRRGGGGWPAPGGGEGFLTRALLHPRWSLFTSSLPQYTTSTLDTIALRIPRPGNTGSREVDPQTLAVYFSTLHYDYRCRISRRCLWFSHPSDIQALEKQWRPYSWSGPVVARNWEVLGSNPNRIECLSSRLCITALEVIRWE